MHGINRTYLLIIAALGLGCESEESQVDEGTVIGQSAVDIDTRVVSTHIGESAIANLIADALVDELVRQSVETDLVFINSGAIRGGLINEETFVFLSDDGPLGQIYPAGDVSDIDVAGWLPFPNPFHILTITGADLKQFLERSASALPPDLAQIQGGWFLQISSELNYSINCEGTRQSLDQNGAAVEVEGSRVVRIVLRGETIYDLEAGIDLLAETEVRLAAPSFIAGGGDGYVGMEGIEDRLVLTREEFDWVTVVQDHIRAHSPISPEVDGRIEIVGDCGRPLTLP